MVSHKWGWRRKQTTPKRLCSFHYKQSYRQRNKALTHQTLFPNGVMEGKLPTSLAQCKLVNNHGFLLLVHFHTHHQHVPQKFPSIMFELHTPSLILTMTISNLGSESIHLTYHSPRYFNLKDGVLLIPVITVNAKCGVWSPSVMEISFLGRSLGSM